MKSNVWSLLDINHRLPGETPSETFPKMVKLLEPGIVSGFFLRGAGWGRRDGESLHNKPGLSIVIVYA